MRKKNHPEWVKSSLTGASGSFSFLFSSSGKEAFLLVVSVLFAFPFVFWEMLPFPFLIGLLVLSCPFTAKLCTSIKNRVSIKSMKNLQGEEAERTWVLGMDLLLSESDFFEQGRRRNKQTHRIQIERT